MAADYRAIAAQCLKQVIFGGHSLTEQLANSESKVADKDHPVFKEICYGVTRWYWRDRILIKQLLQKPLKAKDHDILMLLHIGCYQLLEMRIPDHAALHSTVNASKHLNKTWAKGLINAVLRNVQRQKDDLLDTLSPEQRLSHPAWLVEKLTRDWPSAGDIMAANNSRAPLFLRVNQQKTNREAYLSLLHDKGLAATACQFSAQGIRLEQPAAVSALPGFADGLVYIQDEAAQLSADLLALASKQRVLDACCAPGGKTCHILETEPNLDEVLAIDNDEHRLTSVTENLQRMGLKAELLHADAASPESWWDNNPFDRILLDAPCSATGVIRRHPDIKVLRQASDIETLHQRQFELLKTLWPLLKPGGLLVYATCSILKDENEHVIARFLKQQNDAEHIVIQADWGEARPYGRQLFPHTDGHDGFYYACLEKMA